MKEKLIELAVVSVLILILLAVGVSAWQKSQRPTISIIKADWDCTKTEQQTHLQPMPATNGVKLMPMGGPVCTEYRRRVTGSE